MCLEVYSKGNVGGVKSRSCTFKFLIDLHLLSKTNVMLIFYECWHFAISGTIPILLPDGIKVFGLQWLVDHWAQESVQQTLKESIHWLFLAAAYYMWESVRVSTQHYVVSVFICMKGAIQYSPGWELFRLISGCEYFITGCLQIFQLCNVFCAVL